MRHKYIRFFVSSTFHDMELERNLLQQVFDNLIAKYEKLGWQLEMVDLRWGISKEAGLDNKTMLICKEELARCQQMSPKPNFIILLGERYGWIPLPEIISFEDVQKLKIRKNERSLFDKWYSLDLNALPCGEYILNRRMGEYVDDDVWHKSVERPLSAMFLRNKVPYYGSSATEQEIELGALKVEDASDHVIAYFRVLRNVPREEKNVYKSKSISLKRKTTRLKCRIERHLSETNIVRKELSYKEYKSALFAETFRQEMESHLSCVIDNAIEQYTESIITENERHLAYALEESIGFVGRTKELEEIDNYLHNNDADYGLWYQGASGMGKSALLAKVVERYHNEFDIICRFCGISEDSIDAKKIINTLYQDLQKIDTRKKTKVINDICANLSTPLGTLSLTDYFVIIKNINPQKPILIIIDSLDRVNTIGLPEFDQLKWLDYKLPNNVRVIISSTPEIKYRIEIPSLKKITLNGLGIESMNLIKTSLNNAGRTLTARQNKVVQKAVEQSDKSGLYLRLASRYLEGLPSHTHIESVPFNTYDLLFKYIDTISAPERNGKEIVIRVLCWLGMVRYGLTDIEITEILARDAEYMSVLKTQDQHQLFSTTINKIPSAIWLRLRHDLQPLLRNTHTLAGETFSLFHDSLHRQLTNSNRRCYDFGKELCDYYETAIPNKHALLELVGLYIALYNHCNNTDKLDVIHNIEVLLERNVVFLAEKKAFSPELLADDFDKVMAIASPDVQSRIRMVKHQLFAIRNATSPNDVYAAFLSLPEDSILRKEVEKMSGTENIMRDIIAFNPFVDTTIHSIGILGESPCMSDDGNSIASLTDNCFMIRIEHLDHSVPVKKYILAKQAIEMQADDSLRYLAVRYKDSCILFDAEAGKRLFSHSLSEEGWMSLSATGEHLILGQGNICYYFERETNTLLRYESERAFINMVISPSGKYFWTIDNSYYITRVDTSTQEIMPVGNYRNTDNWDNRRNYYEQNKLLKEWMGNIVCSDTCLIAFNKIIVIDNNNKKEWSIVYLTEDPAHFVQHGFMTRDGKKTIDLFGIIITIPTIGEKSMEIGTISLERIDCLNSDFSIGLSIIEKRIFDFNKEIISFRPIWRNDKKFNNTSFKISSSYNGSQIGVSSYGGFGQFGDIQRNMLRQNENNTYSWNPNPEGGHFCIPTTSISPDGQVMITSTYPFGEVYITEPSDTALIEKKVLRKKVTITDNAMSIAFSNDSCYYAFLTGDRITPADGAYNNIYIFLRNGKQIFYRFNDKEKNFYELFECEKIIFSQNNRFVVIDGNVLDPFNGNLIVQHDDISHGLCDIISSSSLPIVYVVEKWNRGNSFSFDLNTAKERKIESETRLSAISATGRQLFYIADQILYMRLVGEDKHYLLRKNVIEVYPALDERHVYVVDKQKRIILFDIFNKTDIQFAYKGSNERFGYKVCAKGLIVYCDDTGELSLFEPDEKFQVNKPAATTFIRRWNLETQKQEEPTAVCPICGKVFDLPIELGQVLKEYDENSVHYSDWDNKDLFGHYCPHCNASLQVSPYII